MDDAEAGDPGAIDFDMDAGVADIADSLGFGGAENDPEDIDDLGNGEPDAPADPAQAADPNEDTPASPAVREPPKSWAKEQHAHWAKMPPEAQAYAEQREKQMLDGIEQYKGDAGVGRQFRDITAPYEALLRQQGVDAPKAVEYLLAAHQKLSTNPRAALAELAKSYGATDLASIAAPAAAANPELQAVLDKVQRLESTLTGQQQRELTAAREKVAGEVNVFATDPKNAYFDEVADDMMPLLTAGASLQDAYEKAVWANPVTRAKELAKSQTETEKKLRENARLNGLKARKASGSNVRSRDTSRAPTEPLGTWEDTMKDTLKSINERAH